MNEQTTPKGRAGRRTFLTGLLTGAGVAAALGNAQRSAADTAREPKTPADAAKGPILYRRTADVERYYRSLYRA